jgi:transposase
MEATGYSRWFERLLAELGFEVWMGDPVEIKAKRVKKQKFDREDARLLQGRTLLEKLPLAPWASRRRQELLELLDRLNPTIEELTAAAEREAKKRPEVLRLMKHPGVGPLTALAYVLISPASRRPRIHDTRKECGRDVRLPTQRHP